MVPNYIRKIISGWSNYSGMVTSYMIDEKKMGYRGSKSAVISNNLNKVSRFKISAVKEQRVDGSWCKRFMSKNFNLLHLRCTLMDCESNYPFKILSKQLNNRKFSTFHSKLNINPWFITGFSDAESSFFISIYQDKNSKLKWRVTPSFAIHIHIKDIELLENIKNFFGVGKVRKNSISTAIFRVDNIQEIQIIIDLHFVP
jgi:hypothetical protein